MKTLKKEEKSVQEIKKTMSEMLKKYIESFGLSSDDIDSNNGKVYLNRNDCRKMVESVLITDSAPRDKIESLVNIIQFIDIKYVQNK